MEKTEAIKQLDLVQQILEKSNSAMMSGKRMLIAGIIVLFIPLIEYLTRYFTFGFQFSSNADYNEAIIALIHVIFYVLLFLIAFKIIAEVTREKGKEEALHPFISKVLGVETAIKVAIFGSLIILSLIDQVQLILPFVFLFLGILLNLLGRFSVVTIRWFSWSYVILGLLYLYLTQFDITYIWVPFVLYIGISYIFMGIALINKAER